MELVVLGRVVEVVLVVFSQIMHITIRYQMARILLLLARVEQGVLVVAE